MNKAILLTLSILILSFGIPAGSTHAQEIASPVKSGFDVLLGRWVRPDGGYQVTIRGVGTAGKLDAAYANPSPLPFAKAEATMEGGTIKVFLELRAGGYNGSTYDLNYDPEADVLRGIYYQAVARQKYDVYFDRVE